MMQWVDCNERFAVFKLRHLTGIVVRHGSGEQCSYVDSSGRGGGHIPPNDVIKQYAVVAGGSVGQLETIQ